MEPSAAPRTTRSAAAVVGVAVAATAAVTALSIHGLAGSEAPGPEPVAVYSATGGGSGSPGVVPVAVPMRPCAGSYLSTQAAGAAAPAVRAPSAAVP